MLFPSFKDWHRGRECLEELAVRRALSNPYDKSLEEINHAVGDLIINGLKKLNNKEYVFKVRYNDPKLVQQILGPGSYQALDASYPIDEKFWPGWIKQEVELFHKAV